jgi:hypothetical protein
MSPVNFPEAQQFLGRPGDMEEADCAALPICRGVFDGDGAAYPVVISCWEPTAEERAEIAAGGKVYLHLIGRTMQPAMVSTRIEARTLSSAN